MSCLGLYRYVSGRNSESTGRFSISALITCVFVHQNAYRISSPAVWFKLSLLSYTIFCCTAYHCIPVFPDFYLYAKINILNYVNVHNQKKKHFTSHIRQCHCQDLFDFLHLSGSFFHLTIYWLKLIPHFPLHEFLNLLLQHTIQIKEEDRYMCFHSCRWNPETKQTAGNKEGKFAPKLIWANRTPCNIH